MESNPTNAGRARTTPSVPREVLKFAAAALVAMAALAGIAALILRDASENEAIDQAESLTDKATGERCAAKVSI